VSRYELTRLTEETITSLEMTAPDQLAPGRTPPAPLTLRPVGPATLPEAGAVWNRIGAPYGWTGRSVWSDAQWRRQLTRPGVRVWIAMVEEEVAGWVELEAEPTGDVGITYFGLVPEFIGKGFGGALLTLATQLAWTMRAPGGESARRVWLQTSSRDHPHALPNYEARGFRVFRTERRSGGSNGPGDT
jgi:GNAT superfamily N-acetyltransferase